MVKSTKSVKIRFKEGILANITGLESNQIASLQRQFGKNELPTKGDVSVWQIWLRQFDSPLIYILLIVGFLSLFLGQYVDGALALVVLAVNVAMGFYQEYNAQKTLLILRDLLKPTATVIRDGRKLIVLTSEVVPGDVVVVAAGDRIPADGKLLEGVKLLVSEAIITGEEEAILKDEKGNNKLLMGAVVVSGKGTMTVEKIGLITEMGKIGKSIQEIKEEETPLEIRLQHFTRNIAWIIVGVCFLIFLFGIFERLEPWASLKIAIILSIAAIPEALPIALTVILAIGMRRILKRKGLVKKLLSIETLGSTSVICTDKTGTLTEGKMQVKKMETKNCAESLLTFILNNEQKSGLELALWHYAKENFPGNPEKILAEAKKIDEEPFDSEKKYSLSIHELEGEKVSRMMGAPEKVMTFCALGESEKKDILAQIDSWATEGFRLLGLALKKDGNLLEKKEYCWLGLVGIQDPVRPEAKRAIDLARYAGIKIKIVTGDYQKTAERVAKNIGLEIGPEAMLEGEALEKMSDEELKSKIENIVIFSRVLPHQKLRIVEALQKNKEVVAMTGDGVNDTPALKKADIGIAVGEATEVAKEASDLILLDSNFKTIVAACEEGRLILANIKKVVGYVLSNSFAEIILIFGALVLGFSAPLTVVQILWVHLICDGPPDIILGFEPKEKDLMLRKPQEIQKEEILSTGMKYLVVVISAVIGLLSLLIFWHYEKETGNLALAQTLAFATVGSVSLIYIFSFKNLKRSVFSVQNLFSNKYLIYAVIYGFALIFGAVYIPALNRILGTTPLELVHWLVVLGVGLVTVGIVEIIKYFESRQKGVR